MNQSDLAINFSDTTMRLHQLKGRLIGRHLPRDYGIRICQADAIRDKISKRYKCAGNIAPHDYELFFDVVGGLVLKEPAEGG